jgi:hypothetical protein
MTTTFSENETLLVESLLEMDTEDLILSKEDSE